MMGHLFFRWATIPKFCFLLPSPLPSTCSHHVSHFINQLFAPPSFNSMNPFLPSNSLWSSLSLSLALNWIHPQWLKCFLSNSSLFCFLSCSLSYSLASFLLSCLFPTLFLALFPTLFLAYSLSCSLSHSLSCSLLSWMLAPVYVWQMYNCSAGSCCCCWFICMLRKE